MFYVHGAVVESAGSWYWLADLCDALGVDLRLGGSAAVFTY